MKTRVIAVAVMMLLLATGCIAQDQSLGDVARESRARAQGAKPAKVLSNEEADGRAITASDDPVDVVTKAAAAVARDMSHSCRKVVSGNFAGSPLVRLIEIAGPDRVHVMVEQSSPQRTLANLIMIGNDAYEKTGGGPWQKASPAEIAQYQTAFAPSALIPEELKFGYTRENLKLVGPMVIGGSATFQYQSTSHDPETNRTINLWVGAGDYLPRRTEVLTQYLRTKTDRQETTDCTYGTSITIEPPF
jgi:hypothetical protein